MAPRDATFRFAPDEVWGILKQESSHRTDSGTTSASVKIDEPIVDTYQVLTGFQASADAADALVEVIEDVGGTPVVRWQCAVGVNLHVQYRFEGWLRGAIGKDLTVRVTGATAVCRVSAEGFVVHEPYKTRA